MLQDYMNRNAHKKGQLPILASLQEMPNAVEGSPVFYRSKHSSMR